MNWKTQIKSLLVICGIFLVIYFLPTDNEHFIQAVVSALSLAKWYAREHILLCLVPAFFIAGAISVFISQAAVIKYFGAAARKWLSYTVASVSGTILAVCSCTVLPLFSGIYSRGAGIGPAVAFLYSGPAINILAIILTARILGFELGVARVIGAVLFSVVIGLIMHFIYRKEESAKVSQHVNLPDPDASRPLWQTSFHFVTLVAILVFANWGNPDRQSGFWYFMFTHKWWITAGFGLLLVVSLLTVLKIKSTYIFIAISLVGLFAILFPDNPLISFSVGVIALSVVLSFSSYESQIWLQSSWGFAKQILPLLAVGVLVAGFLLGMPDGSGGIVPTEWIADFVGGNSMSANFLASIVGAFMYFATLTEVPIVQGLVNNGMGKGPALALLLAGPAISLPNMLVIRSVVGTQKTFVFVTLVVVMATVSGLIYGRLL